SWWLYSLCWLSFIGVFAQDSCVARVLPARRADSARPHAGCFVGSVRGEPVRRQGPSSVSEPTGVRLLGLRSRCRATGLRLPGPSSGGYGIVDRWWSSSPFLVLDVCR